MKKIEEGLTLMLDFGKIQRMKDLNINVIPVVVQNFDNNEVIMVGYVSSEAFEETRKSGYAVFYSTSRKEIWRKGATSGDRLKIVEIRVNCEQNSLLYKVILENEGACHTKRVDGTKRPSCFYRTVGKDQFITFSDD